MIGNLAVNIIDMGNGTPTNKHQIDLEYLFRGYTPGENQRLQDFYREIDKFRDRTPKRDIPLVKSLSELRNLKSRTKEPHYQRDYRLYKETLDLLVDIYFP